MSYQERLATYTEGLARSTSRSLSTSLEPYQEQPSTNMTSLFAPPPQPSARPASGGVNQAALDDMGKALGGAAQARNRFLLSVNVETQWDLALFA